MKTVAKYIVFLIFIVKFGYSNSSEKIVYEDHCDSMNFCFYTVKTGQGSYILNYLKMKLYGLGSSQSHNEFIELLGNEIRWRHPDEAVSRVILETCHALDVYRDSSKTSKIQLSVLVYQMSEEYFSQFKTDFNFTLKFLDFLSTDTISKTFSANIGEGNLNADIMSSSWGAFQFEALIYNAKKQRKIISQKEILLPPVNNADGITYETETATVYRDSTMGADKENAGINFYVSSVNINDNQKQLNKENPNMTISLSGVSIKFAVPVKDKPVNESEDSQSNIIVKTKNIFINQLDLRDSMPNVVVAEVSQENLLLGGKINIINNDKMSYNQQDKFLIIFKANILDPDYLFLNNESETTIQNLITPREDDVELTEEGLNKLMDSNNVNSDLENLFLSISAVNLNDIITPDRLKKMAIKFSPEHLRKDFAKSWINVEFKTGNNFFRKKINITKRIEHLTIVPFKIGKILSELGIATMSPVLQSKEKNSLIDVKIVFDSIINKVKSKDSIKGIHFKLYYIPSAAGGTLELIEESKDLIYNRSSNNNNSSENHPNDGH